MNTLSLLIKPVIFKFPPRWSSEYLMMMMMTVITTFLYSLVYTSKQVNHAFCWYLKLNQFQIPATFQQVEPCPSRKCNYSKLIWDCFLCVCAHHVNVVSNTQQQHTNRQTHTRAHTHTHAHTHITQRKGEREREREVRGSVVTFELGGTWRGVMVDMLTSLWLCSRSSLLSPFCWAFIKHNIKFSVSDGREGEGQGKKVSHHTHKSFVRLCKESRRKENGSWEKCIVFFSSHTYPGHVKE